MKTAETVLKGILCFSLVAGIGLYSGCGEDPDTGPDAPALTDTITEKITTNTVLEDIGQGVDYYICGYITVDADLTIKPNVTIVMCANAEIYVSPNGSFNAVGTADASIIIKGEVGTKGYWDGIEIDGNNPNNQIAYATISDGGGENNLNHTTIWVNNNNNGQLSISNTTIENSKNMGIYVENGASLPNFFDNHFKNNGGAPLVIPLSIIGAVDAQSDYADGNGKNYIEVYHATLNQSTTVVPTNVPYLLTGYSQIEAGLTLQPGVQFLMGVNAEIYVDPVGFFNAIGTAGNPITITGEVQAAGYWDGIEFDSNNPKNEFAYVTLSYGGGENGLAHSTIWVNNNNSGQFTINNCTITNSYNWAIYVENGATITPNTIAAIESANTFSNNGSGATANCTGNCNVYFQ